MNLNIKKTNKTPDREHFVGNSIADAGLQNRMNLNANNTKDELNTKGIVLLTVDPIVGNVGNDDR